MAQKSPSTVSVTLQLSRRQVTRNLTSAHVPSLRGEQVSSGDPCSASACSWRAGRVWVLAHAELRAGAH